MSKVFTIDSDNYFTLAPSFLATYQNTQPKWGPVGYVTYKRTYARPILNENGDVVRTEEFWETLQRVVEGVYTMQKHHIRSSRRRWDEARAQASAQIMYRKMWDFKFLPPGRGLWAWYLPLLENKGGGALNNCAFISTENIDIDFAEPFCFLMDFSMLGVGVGFDTEGAGKVSLVKAPVTTDPYVVEDTREGWINLIRTILNAFIGKAKLPVSYKKLPPSPFGLDGGTICRINIDVSKVRPEGTSIKGFGGTASGPEPLIELAKALVDLLHKRASSDTPLLTSTDIVDIMNLIGKCVVAGNVRRSSEIAIGNREDKEFLKLKDPTESFDLQKKMKRHASQNKQWKQYEEDIISLKKSIQQYGILAPESIDFQRQISELETLQSSILKSDLEYQKLYKEFKALPLNNHRWASNNTVDFPLGSGYERVGKQIATNGEPGISWLEVIKKYGRLIDPPNDKDRRAKGFNPCLHGHTLVTTDQGLYKIEDLVGKSPNIWTGSKWEKITNFRVTAKDQKLLKITLYDGSYLKVTPYHSMILEDGTRIEAKELKIGHKLKQSIIPTNGLQNELGAYLKGFMVGDGHKNVDIPVLWLYSPKYMCEERLKSSASELSLNLDFGGEFTNRACRAAKGIRDSRLFPYVDKYKYTLPSSAFTWNLNSKLEFIAGVMDADGTASDTQNGFMYQIASINKQWLIDFQTLLKTIGVLSKLSLMRKAGSTDFNDGYGPYETKNCYRLTISQSAAILLSSLVKFERLASFSNKKTKYSISSRFSNIISIEEDEVAEDVYCCTIPSTSSFTIGIGVHVGQCSEQTLESYELCCLVETFPTNHANLTEYLDTLKYAYLYAKTVTLIPTHYEQTNEVISRNRRIGTSMAGVAELYCNLGMQEMIRWFDKGYQRICELDKQYSEWLGIPESNKKTSMKPGGTIPLLVGKEGGQRFSESEFYFRTIRCDRTSKLVEMFEQAGYRVEDDIYTPRSKVIYFPIHDTASKRFAADISIWEQVMLMSVIQAYWSDNQVSATIMFKPEEAKDIPLILSAFEGRLKTISFLPLEDHGYLQAPYIKCTKEQYESYASSLKEPDWSMINNTHEAEDKFCEGDKCLIPLKK